MKPGLTSLQIICCTDMREITGGPPHGLLQRLVSLTRGIDRYWQCTHSARLLGCGSGQASLQKLAKHNSPQRFLRHSLHNISKLLNPKTMKLINLYRVTLTGLLVCTLSAFGQQGSNNVEQRVDSILSQMTLGEKLSYIGGTGFFDVKPIPVPNLQVRFNPQLLQTDAGLGVRITPASVRYPAGPVLAATWNPDRARDLGSGLGRDTRARGFFTILGPGMDFYRTPFGGRNFEYATGEDPFLGSQLVPEVIKKIQEQGVWACAKHFVCNDQEANRTNINTVIDERTLREIYLPPFEAAVKEGHTATVMGAYNFMQIGTLPSAQCNESSFLLNEVLKKEWGFKGFVMSDYLAIHDGVKAYLGGCDLELPASKLMSSPTVGALILNGTLPESILEDKVRRILREVVSFGFLDRQQLDSSIPLDDPKSELAALDTAREGI